MLKKRIISALGCLIFALTVVPVGVMAKQNPIPLVRNVRITGNAVVGQTLTGSYEYWGQDTEGVTATYQWYVTTANRAKQLSINYTKISGATTERLTLTSAHKGLSIVFETVVKDSTGTHTFRSPALGVVEAAAEQEGAAAVPKASNAKPVLSYNYNTSQPDRLFAHYTYADVNAGENDAEADSVIQWLRGDSLNGEYMEIPGATGVVYELTEEDRAKPHFFKFRVTPKNKAGETGECVTSWGMGVGNLLPTVQSNPISNGKTATGAHYTTYNATGTYYHYWYKYCDGDYDSTYGYTANNTSLSTPSITGLDLGSAKKVNTLVIYGGNFNGSDLFQTKLMHSAADRKNYVDIPVTTCYKPDPAKETYKSFLTASAPVEIRIPEFTDRYIYLQTSRAQSSIGEIQAYYLDTPESVTVTTDCPETIKLPVGIAQADLPDITVKAVNSIDSSAVPESDIFVQKPILPEASQQKPGQTYPYNITVKDSNGGLTLVQRTVELTEPELELKISTAFTDGEQMITTVGKGKNEIVVTAVNELYKEASVQPVAVLYHGDVLESVQVGKKTLLKGESKAYTFSFEIDDPAERSIRILAWKDMENMEPLTVTNDRLPAPGK